MKRFLLSLFAAIPQLIVTGWAVSVLWRWFLVPATGVAPISIAQTAGLLLLASMFTTDLAITRSPASETPEWPVASFFAWAVISVTAVGAGWIILQFAS